MEFPNPQPNPPAAVHHLDIHLRYRMAQGDDDPEQRGIRYNFELVDADGQTVATRTGNLAPYLTPQQLSQAQAFLEAMLQKAQALIPTG
jgi:hypothetical protein